MMWRVARSLLILLAASLGLAACNLPRATPTPANPNAFLTAAAQTVEVQLTMNALQTPQATLTSPPSATPPPPLPPTFTNTPPSTPSPTPICDLAQFVADVTVPDGTTFQPGETFVKTWRLKNIGVCTWTNGYQLIFDSGDAMSGPASQALAGSVAPGQTVDISVTLKAPTAPGTYRGYWRLRNAAGVLMPVSNGFKGTSFFVEIKVNPPTPTASLTPSPTPPSAPAVTQIILTPVAAESGQVRSSGSVLSPPNTGDLDTNETAQAFLSFNISGIPVGATITQVKVDFSSYDTLGNPWSLGDGCLRAYIQNYGTPDAGDFFPGDPLGALMRWCGPAELSSVFEDNNVKSALQAAIGTSRFQLRVQFRPPTTNNNGIADMIRLGAVKLIVTYQY
ncbi:MAG: NBR1-Ig-like domain-containing protein [Anaerolineales bacterium]|nr:NBR1-Ig-like domain-containing protein [Anaerolineales bacterium]MCX7754986.1 NBR1-Ig-like domain-containing protein [Anaerolineales bacterium]MDW8277364.1 NBR1-Ig-like domain-containing protein [Anaerolineales bacterium]